MTTFLFFLEEPSAEEMLKGILPRILPENITTKFIVFDGKQDLEKQLERKLRGWRLTNTHFVVLRDQDAGDCNNIKTNLVNKCHNAGKDGTLVRIACHELESFYLGDLAAVELGLKIDNIRKLQNKRKYREPDNLANPSTELKDLTNQKYYKISGSRAISPHLSIDNSNCSHSFRVLISGLRRLLNTQLRPL